MTEFRIHMLEELGDEFAAAESRAAAATVGRRRLSFPRQQLALVVGVLLLLAVGTYVVPATRAGVENLGSAFGGWVGGGDENPPGVPVPRSDNLRKWFTGDGDDARLIAKTGGISLYVSRADSGGDPRALAFGFRKELGAALGVDGRQVQRGLDHKGIYLLGTDAVLDERGFYPIYGITRTDVREVELRYAEGPPVVQETDDDAFVLISDARRAPTQLVALGVGGKVVGRVDARTTGVRYICAREPGCVPDR